MLFHYIDYIKGLEKDLQRRGVPLDLSSEVNRDNVADQVMALENFYYVNSLFRASGGTSYIPSIYKETAHSYLRTLFFKEFDEQWVEEVEQLTRQPDDAGVIIKEVASIESFIERLGLQKEELVDEQPDDGIITVGLSNGTPDLYQFGYQRQEYRDFDDFSDEEFDDNDFSTFSEEDTNMNFEDYTDDEVDDFDEDYGTDEGDTENFEEDYSGESQFYGYEEDEDFYDVDEEYDEEDLEMYDSDDDFDYIPDEEEYDDGEYDEEDSDDDYSYEEDFDMYDSDDGYSYEEDSDEDDFSMYDSDEDDDFSMYDSDEDDSDEDDFSMYDSDEDDDFSMYDSDEDDDFSMYDSDDFSMDDEDDFSMDDEDDFSMDDEDDFSMDDSDDGTSIDDYLYEEPEQKVREVNPPQTTTKPVNRLQNQHKQADKLVSLFNGSVNKARNKMYNGGS